MAEIGSFFKRPRDLTAVIDDIPVAVSYNPTGVTVEDFIRLQGLDDDDIIRSGLDVATILSHTLVSWDMTRGGEPIPLDTDSLRDLPPIFLVSILGAITNDLSPKVPEVSTPSGSLASSPSPSPTPPSASGPAKRGTTGQRAPRGSRSTS